MVEMTGVVEQSKTRAYTAQDYHAQGSIVEHPWLSLTEIEAQQPCQVCTQGTTVSNDRCCIFPLVAGDDIVHSR